MDARYIAFDEVKSPPRPRSLDDDADVHQPPLIDDDINDAVADDGTCADADTGTERDTVSVAHTTRWLLALPLLSRHSRYRSMISSSAIQSLISNFIAFRRFVLRFHRTFLIVYVGFVTLVVTLLLYYHGFAAATAHGAPEAITCHNIYWPGALTCGDYAENCAPFSSSDYVELLRCPSRCDWPNLSQRIIGDQQYRADSYICAAAIHSGVIGNNGGCLRLRITGARTNFASVARNGITSQSYPTWFPKTFALAAADGAKHCESIDNSLLVAGIILLSFLCLLFPSPLLLLYCLMLWGYWYVSLTMSDGTTPEQAFFSGTIKVVYLIVFTYVLYILGVDVTLTAGESRKRPVASSSVECETSLIGCSSESDLVRRATVSTSTNHRAVSENEQTETKATSRYQRLVAWFRAPSNTANFTLHRRGPRTRPWYQLVVLYVLPYVAALHWDYLSLILPNIDLNSQAFSHGLVGLLVIFVFSVMTLSFIVLQIRLLQAARLLRHYAKYYGCVLVVVLVISVMWRENYSLHLHHVYIGALLVPLTRFRTKLSLLVQAVLLGMFVNGLAMWGVDSLWDYTPTQSSVPSYDDIIDGYPPSTLSVLNVSDTSMDLVWPLRNHSGSALGSLLLVNNVQMFQRSFQRTNIWVNTTSSNSTGNGTVSVRDSGRDGDVSLPLIRDDGAYVSSVNPRTGKMRYGRYDPADRHYHRNAHPRRRRYQSASDAIDGEDDRLYLRHRVDGLLPGLNYTVSACYTFTYLTVGPCQERVLATLDGTRTVATG